MRSLTLVRLAVFGLASMVIASPGGHRPGDEKSCNCLTRADATELSEAYTRLVGAFNIDDANRYLSDDFEDVSQSINTFINKPFDAVTFDKTSFIKTQSKPEGLQTPIFIEGEPIFHCNTIIVIWTSTFGAGRPVRGITIIKAVSEYGKWRMKHWDVEFNSLNWAFDMGQYYCLFGHAFGNPSVCGAGGNTARELPQLAA